VKLDLPDEYIAVTIRALEHYAAYMKATNRDEGTLRAAETFRGTGRKAPAREEPVKTGKKKRA